MTGLLIGGLLAEGCLLADQHRVPLDRTGLIWARNAEAAIKGLLAAGQIDGAILILRHWVDPRAGAWCEATHVNGPEAAEHRRALAHLLRIYHACAIDWRQVPALLPNYARLCGLVRGNR